MSVRNLPGFDALSGCDKAELLRFEAYLKRRHENPKEPPLHAYADEYNEYETLYEDPEYKKKP